MANSAKYQPGQQAHSVISVLSSESIGQMLAPYAPSLINTVAGNAANRAYFFPFALSKATSFKGGFTRNGAAASGNLDIGIYDTSGNRLVSTGSTAMSGTDVVQAIDFSSPYLAAPGNYYMALSVDNTSAQFWGAVGAGGIAADFMRSVGVKTNTTSFPLPSSISFATANNNLLVFGLYQTTI